MRTFYFIIIFTILFTNCNSTSKLTHQSNDKILYILPIEVEKELKLYIDKNNKNGEDVCFEIRRDSESNFIIFLDESETYWKKTTNRYIAINQNIYPVYFDYDFLFGSGESSEKVLEKLKKDSEDNEFARKTIYNIYDNVFRIKFTKKGRVLYKGFN